MTLYQRHFLQRAMDWFWWSKLKTILITDAFMQNFIAYFWFTYLHKHVNTCYTCVVLLFRYWYSLVYFEYALKIWNHWNYFSMTTFTKHVWKDWFIVNVMITFIQTGLHLKDSFDYMLHKSMITYPSLSFYTFKN